MARLLNRDARYVLWLCCLIAPLVISGAMRTIHSNANRIADWLPADLPETVALRQFNAWFGTSNFVVISWEGCRLGDSGSIGPRPVPLNAASDIDDPRLQQLADLLSPTPSPSPPPPRDFAQRLQLWSDEFDAALAVRQLPNSETPTPEECRRYFRQVLTTRQLLTTLTSPPLSLSKQAARQRLSGNLLGPDGQAGLIVFLHDTALDDLAKSIGIFKPRWIERNRRQGVLLRALAACNIPLEDAHFGGPPIDNRAIDEEGKRTLFRLAGLSGLLGLTLAWWSLRSISLTAIVFACGLLSACTATALVSWTGSHADAIVLSMPSLIYVLAISGAVHLVNYYREALHTVGLHDAPRQAVRMGFRPALLCSATTAFGLLALLTSTLAPIRRFGFYSALGVMIMLVVLFLVLPAALQVWGARGRWLSLARRPEEAPSPSREPSRTWTHRFTTFLVRYPRWVTIGCFGFTLLMGVGLARIRTSIDLLKLFDDQTRILGDYRWLEEHLGYLVPLEVLVEMPHALPDPATAGQPTSTAQFLENARAVQTLHQEIWNHFGHTGTDVIAPPLSSVTFLPSLPSQHRGVSGMVKRRVLDAKLRQSQTAMVDSGYLWIDTTQRREIWRISIRVAAFRQIDYGAFAKEIEQTLAPCVARMNATRTTEQRITTRMTGAVPIVYKAQRALLESLMESSAWSFITITPLLIWVTGGVMAGGVAMLPNLLPIVVVFGGMGWLDRPVDIGAMMTASIALGVAVDDTIHYLCWFRHALDDGLDRESAILSASSRCIAPTVQAALINGLGLSIFALSSFTPTQQFGLLMLAILLLGAIAELIMLPALLASPLGRVFKSRLREN